jgi:hypothetical protein
LPPQIFSPAPARSLRNPEPCRRNVFSGSLTRSANSFAMRTSAKSFPQPL